MRILVLGAGGFIGRHILADLLGAGHDVIGVARATGALGAAFPEARFISIDLAKAVAEADWAPHLAGVDVIVNAAGLLRGREMEAVHVAMPRALHGAAARAGVKRVVLISAISARADVATDYARTKLAGEAALREAPLDWTILRPSLVYGDGSYGGTSLMRGMAGLPFAMTLPGRGDFAFTPIHARDLARTVRIACEGGVPPRTTLEPVGPETMTLRELLARYRRWLGFGRARFVSVPMPLMRLFGRIGDMAGDGPIATNSLVQMVAGNAGDSAAFADAIGFAPRGLDTALRDRPAQVQDRWHARLFFLAPLLRAVLVLMWLASAWLGVAYGAARTGELVDALGLPRALADPLRYGSSLLDIAIAGYLLFGRSAARGALIQLAVVAGYTLVIGFALPQLWLDPLGPLLKNLPVMVAIAVHGVIGDKR
ncbi:SDR family oxidoreductase [Stakelama tenebrarum]|uniref:SDR family oxidoreductase n=1 Tax=Stakelama tenebrarum TaxID=2711215 RepID=A0A6G6Y6K4_9SPHN|nr:SDR family oxidoreductase [Sphingosinithalassobacter tenebrarum]QIG80427.1 SDR family oxidoreductase [Sphingosinithalassobacter tenebrarum]